MKILGRSHKRVAHALRQLPDHIVASYRCFKLFRRPLDVLWSYIRRRNPQNRSVILRDGLVIRLSEDNADIVSVFLIYCRRDYGNIPAGSVVVDVGANIGVFALYAAKAGARMVQAYEPAEESFDLLKENIVNNGFAEVIFPHRAAVVGKYRPSVWFPRQSSVFNAIDADSESTSDRCLVPTIMFSVLANGMPEPNIFKLDCEGGEYDIILNSEDSVFDGIKEIRLEYHQGPREQLIDRLKKVGFHCRQFMDEGEGGGYLWLTKAGAKSGENQ